MQKFHQLKLFVEKHGRILPNLAIPHIRENVLRDRFVLRYPKIKKAIRREKINQFYTKVWAYHLATYLVKRQRYIEMGRPLLKNPQDLRLCNQIVRNCSPRADNYQRKTSKGGFRFIKQEITFDNAQGFNHNGITYDKAVKFLEKMSSLFKDGNVNGFKPSEMRLFERLFKQDSRSEKQEKSKGSVQEPKQETIKRLENLLTHYNSIGYSKEEIHKIEQRLAQLKNEE